MSAHSQLRQARLTREMRVFGAWTSIGHPSITEIFAASGVDFIGIDIEHSTISLEQAQRIIAASQSAGVACFPRISSHNGEQIKRLLDSGADGIIVPMVNTPDEVKSIVDWIKYPPAGRRSFGVARAQGYGFAFDDYTSGWNSRSSIIIQIESIAAVDCIDALLAHPSVDGVMIGPYDMSGSLGIPGQITNSLVTGACRKVIDACRRHNKACGAQVIEATEEAAANAFASGYTFVVLASDVFVLWKWSDRMRNIMRDSK